MAHKPRIQSLYLDAVFHPTVIKRFLRAARKAVKGVEFEAIAFRGISGALVAPTLAYSLRKTLIVVRKPPQEEKNHSHLMIEGDSAAKHYLIVDDFMATGATVSHIIGGIHARFNSEAVCIGGLFYQDFLEAGISLEITPPKNLPGYADVCELQKIEAHARMMLGVPPLPGPGITIPIPYFDEAGPYTPLDEEIRDLPL